MTPTAVVISDAFRPPVTVSRRMEGGLVVASGSRYIMLSDSELARLIEFVQPRIQRFPAQV
jgi:hypothetical protein